MASTVTITGTIETPDGQPHRGRVLLTATPGTILDAAGHKVFTGTAELVLDAQGSFTVTVPASDDPTLNPTGFTYTLTPSLAAGFAPEVTFVAPAATPTLDYAQLAPAAASPGTVVDPALATVAQVNSQAFAGGRYDLGNYASKPGPSSTTTEAPTPAAIAGVSDVQALAAGGWDLTGKGGLYRLSVYGDFYLGRAIAAGESADMSLSIKRRSTGESLYGQTWSTNVVGTYAPSDHQKPDAYLYVSDDFGALDFVYTTSSPADMTVAPDFTIDLQRIAGWPQA